MAVQLLLQPDLDQRLIRHVPRVCGVFDGVQQVLGQPQRNRFGRGFQVRQRDLFGFRPVKVLGGVVRFPERALLRLVGELRYGFSLLVHKWLAPFGACPWLR